MTLIRIVVAALSIGTFASASVALADGYTCNAIAKNNWCTEYPASSKTLVEAGGAAKLGNICKAQGGEWSAGTSCPAANDLGACKSERGTNHTYTPKAQAAAHKNCRAPSAWVAAK